MSPRLRIPCHDRRRPGTCAGVEHSPEQLLRDAGFVHRLAAALLRDAELAQDVAQDALLAALQHRGALPASPRGWLAAVTRRLAARARRQQAIRRRHEQQLARPEHGCDERLTQQRLLLHRQLCEAVLSLPEPYRTTVTLRHLDGMTPRAIGRQLSRDVALVRQHLHRGLAMLRQRLERDFGDRDGWTAAFAACGLGLGGATLTSTLMPVLAMKKLVAAAVLFLAVGSWWLLHDRGDPAPPPVADAAAVAAAARLRLAEKPPPTATADTTWPVQETRTELRFDVQVVDEALRPLAGVTVRCWRQRGEALVRHTDASGRAAFAPADEAGVLRIEAGGRAPLLQLVSRLLGEQQIVLPRGGEVSGHMLVDGAPAPAGLVLSLRLPTPTLPEGLPLAARHWLQSAAAKRWCDTCTDAGGGFCFLGLADDWAGVLRAPQPFLVLPGPGGIADLTSPRQQALARPQRQVVLATTQLQTISGCVVWDDDGEPVPSPQIMAHGDFLDGQQSPSFGCTGDAAGCFAIGFYPGRPNRMLSWCDPARRSPLRRVQLDVRVDGCDAATALELADERLHRPIVVRLPRPMLRHFLVIDGRGQPVAGAVVEIDGGTLSEATGSDGHGTFAADHASLVGAPGFQVTRARPRQPAAGTIADPFVYELQPDNELQIRLRTPAGNVPAARRVQLTASVDLFAGARFQTALDRQFGSDEADCMRRGKNQPDGSIRWHESTASMQASSDGLVTLHSLAPGVACKVALMDALGIELAAQQIVLPAAGEQLVVDLQVAAAPRQLRGRVVGVDAAPLPNVTVRLQAGQHGVQTTTDRDGTFAFADIYTDEPVRLVASGSGFAAAARAGLGREADLQPIEFCLQRGRQVHVTVRDDCGAVVPLRIEVAALVADDHHPQVLAAGDYAFADLPPGTVTFHVDLGGQRFELHHDTSVGEGVLRVPQAASVAIAAPPGWPAEPGTTLAAVATRQDVAAEPFAVRLDGADRPPQLLLPGRYRIELVAQRWRDGQEQRTVLGPAATVELRAGDNARVQLH